MERASSTALLIAQNGILSNKQWFIDQELVVGRETGCDVIINDRQVSRRHARFFIEDGVVMIEDLRSKNGTYINHEKITTKQPLKEGDLIQIALIQEFLFISSDATIPLIDGRTSRLITIMYEDDSVWVRDQKIDPPLSVAQFNLMQCLYENADNIVSRMDIVERVWVEESGAGISNEAIDALVRRLRYRLADYDPDTEFIETVRGYGFRLNNPIVA